MNAIHGKSKLNFTFLTRLNCGPSFIHSYDVKRSIFSDSDYHSDYLIILIFAIGRSTLIVVNIYKVFVLTIQLMLQSNWAPFSTLSCVHKHIVRVIRA